MRHYSFRVCPKGPAGRGGKRPSGRPRAQASRRLRAQARQAGGIQRLGSGASMGRSLRRGDVRWYKFTVPDKRRPVVLLTRESALSYLNEVTVAPITSTMRDTPAEVRLTQADGLLNECAVNLDHVQTVSKSKIGALITRLDEKRMNELRSALMFALGLEKDLKR